MYKLTIPWWMSHAKDSQVLCGVSLYLHTEWSSQKKSNGDCDGFRILKDWVALEKLQGNPTTMQIVVLLLMRWSMQLSATGSGIDSIGITYYCGLRYAPNNHFPVVWLRVSWAQLISTYGEA